jgi:hypothetical protein
MLTTAGDVALMIGASDGSATPTEVAAPSCGMRADNNNAMKDAFTSV